MEWIVAARRNHKDNSLYGFPRRKDADKFMDELARKGVETSIAKKKVKVWRR
jgi:adenine C2-methylase RlmN of 23S rRNA A2503 and tRNA A37